MMLLKSFMAHEIIFFLEKEFEAREPQFQQILLDDINHELKKVFDWLNKKISATPKTIKGD